MTHEIQRLVGGLAMGPYIPREEHLALEDHLLRAMRRRNDRLPLFKLQTHILQDVMIEEKRIALFKEHRGSSDDARAGVEREVFMRRMLLNGLRDVADGIAWRLFEYDRAIVRQVATRRGRKHIEGGIEQELQVLAALQESEQHLGMLNDLTSFVRIGDVTIKGADGSYEFIEVKEGRKTSGRITRQKQDMRRVATFLTDGETIVDGQRAILLDLPVVPETHIRALRDVVDKAQSHGGCTVQVSDSLALSCLDFERLGPSEEDARATVAGVDGDLQRILGAWRGRGDMVIDLPLQQRYVGDGQYAPFSIFPLPTLTRVRLATGALSCRAAVNVSAVIRYVQAAGWACVESMEDVDLETDDVPPYVATFRKGPFTIGCAGDWFGRLVFDLVKPRTLRDIIDAAYHAGPDVSDLALVALTGERDVWD
jgi:hypothetical protein